MKYLFFLLLLIMNVTGCAKDPYHIQPSYIPSKTYQGYNCEELSKETKKIYPTFIKLRAALEKDFYKNDKFGDFFGFSIFPPLALTKNDKEEAECAELKGHLYAIKDKSEELGCEIMIILPQRKNFEKSHP